MADASEGARGQIAGRAAPLYADARTEGVKTASRMAWTGGGAREFSTRMGHERRKRSTGEDWGRAVDLHIRGARAEFSRASKSWGRFGEQLERCFFS